jgi:hypothetical protein
MLSLKKETYYVGSKIAASLNGPPGSSPHGVAYLQEGTKLLYNMKDENLKFEALKGLDMEKMVVARCFMESSRSASIVDGGQKILLLSGTNAVC